jgi:hypothetical protein
MYADALLLLFELADREDERFQFAAARWHARFVLEANMPLREVKRAGLTRREISRELAGPAPAYERS